MGYLPNLTQISDALGWAVLHSLWQGALAAVLVWGFRNLTRESSADTRYMFGFVTLCTLLAAFIGTFVYYYSLGGAAAAIGGEVTQSITLPIFANQAAPIGNPLLRVTDYTALVGGIWTICFAVLGVRYLSAFRLTHKLRTSGISDLPSNWQGKFNQLAKRSNVTGKVRGFISEHVSSPITFGFFKPIILVPAWFFSGLTPEQCEAVLLHEFAHIRRHDYLTNIIQILVKTVFFYHPAIGYISKVIDEDREHACDDFAVLVTNSPEMLAKALGTIRINAARDGGVFALSADGPEAPLMHRLKRLMGAPVKKTHSGSGRGYAATLMIATAGALTLGLGATDSLAHPHKPDTETLAGASKNERIQMGNDFGNKIVFKGETYKATSFDYRKDDNGHDIINGKSYHPSNYMYSVYAKDGISYVVKKKDNGKKYIEIGNNWYWIGNGKNESKKYAFNTTNIAGNTYKTKTNTDKNQTFIKIKNKWYDIDKANLDVLLPTPPVTPAPPEPPKYSYTYAFKDGQKYKIKTKNKTGKTYIRIDSNWEKASTSGGGDHGHRHIKIDDKWVNINGNDIQVHVDTNTHVDVNIEPPTPPTSPNYWIDDKVRRNVEAALERASIQREEATKRREETLERAAERREDAFERAVEQRERAAERRAEALERAADQRERASEQRERAQERIEHAQEARERKRDDKQLANYEEMRDQLIPVLKADGYLNKKNATVIMDMTKEDIFINGELLTSVKEAKYCKIVSEYGMRKDDTKQITIKPDSFQISSIGKHGDTRVTIGTF